MERVGQAVIRAYDLGLLARAPPTGWRYDGLGWAAGAGSARAASRLTRSLGHWVRPM